MKVKEREKRVAAPSSSLLGLLAQSLDLHDLIDPRIDGKVQFELLVQCSASHANKLRTFDQFSLSQREEDDDDSRWNEASTEPMLPTTKESRPFLRSCERDESVGFESWERSDGGRERTEGDVPSLFVHRERTRRRFSLSERDTYVDRLGGDGNLPKGYQPIG